MSDASCLNHHFTRFADEILGARISLIFIVQAVRRILSSDTDPLAFVSQFCKCNGPTSGLSVTMFFLAPMEHRRMGSARQLTEFRGARCLTHLSHNSARDNPIAAADSGTRLCDVMPGIVLISST